MARSWKRKCEVLAGDPQCDGIICGHIHTPEDKQVGDIHYLNSGDWVESLTAIIEHPDGRLELVHYQEFMERMLDEDRQVKPDAVRLKKTTRRIETAAG